MSEMVYDVRMICTIRELIETSADEYNALTAYVLKDKNGDLRYVTYKHLLSDVKALATYLNSLGFENKKLAVIGKNCYEWAITYLAVTAGVGVIVPIDKELKSPEVNNILSLSESSAVVYAPEIEAKLSECTHNCTRICMNTLEECIAKGKELMENGDATYAKHVIDPYALGVLIYTSGTTGVAKGVMLSQYNICADIMGVRKHVLIAPVDRTISVLPLHHTYEATAGFLSFLYSGASIAFCSSLLHLLQEFKEYQPTVFIAVPQLLKAIHKGIINKVAAVKGGMTMLTVGKTITTLSGKFAPSLAPHLFKSIHEAFGGRLNRILIGAAALEPDVFKDFEKFGFAMYNGYGLTETAPVCVMHFDNARKCDTIGKPIGGVHAKIVEPNADGIGELAIKGPNVMLGYYNDEKHTREAFDDEGYFLTGDLVCIDKASGHYKIVGRLKNMIVTANGKKIFPEEIEYLLEPCECVKECMAYGDVNEEGQTVVAVKIFPNFDELEKIGIEKTSPDFEDKMQEYFLKYVKESVNRRLPGYKAVHKVTIRHTEFDKTTTQKIKRTSEENLRTND